MDAPVSFAPGVPGGRREIMSGSGSMKSGVTDRYKTVLAWADEPPDNFGHLLGGGILGGGMTVDANGIHRVMVDKRNEFYFGYDLVIGAGYTANGHLTTFLPPSNIDRLLETIGGGKSRR